MSTLLLRFAGPLQSWGDDSRFNHRRTYSIPTKSAVIGMIASALGRDRSADVEDLAALQLGIRVDQPGEIITDFQMVNGPTQADVTNRDYISDAIFLIGLMSDDRVLLQQIKNALAHPKYPLFLGRRACPPSYPLIIGIREKSLEEALLAEPWLASAWRQPQLNSELRIVLEGNADSIGSLQHRLRDIPISYDPRNRIYQYRYVKEAGHVNKNKTAQTEHDAFEELE